MQKYENNYLCPCLKEIDGQTFLYNKNNKHIPCCGVIFVLVYNTLMYYKNIIM